jgi:hypothetical protein
MADQLILSINDDAPEGAALLTIPGGIGLYRKRITLEVGLDTGGGFTAEARFENCFFRLGSNGDSFLGNLIPGAEDSQDFTIGFHWDAKGFSFTGRGMLEITIPVRAKTPFVKLEALHIIATPQSGDSVSIAVELSADLTGSFLGVISTSIERLGIIANFYLTDPKPADAISLGPLVATAKFKPPTGVGLSVDVAGVVKGGGFLSIDPDRGRYAGVLSLNLFGIGVTAIGIINTKPDFSFLIIITADFKPVGIDISFGFTINAVGGLFGLHRGVDLSGLSTAVRTNSIASLLFPAHPVEDAPRIINDLERIFPAVHNHFLIGPMLELGWGKPAGMFSLSLGVVIELPDPKIAIIGILRVLVPPIDEALLRIQVNFVGSVDFAQQFLRFDASLFDSRLMMYTLEGDMAARLLWGSNANFAVSVGGFNPRFVPAADLDISPMKRVAINLLPTDDNPRLRIESYYAVTSNTLQHGARLEAYAAAAGFGLKGFLGYDLLAQISPLHFEADFGGSVAIIADDEEIMSLTLDLHLSGPSPWHVDGEVHFKVIVVPVTIPVHATFGGSDAPAVPDTDVAEKFRGQLNNSANWTAKLLDQSQLLVTLAPSINIAKEEILAHPSATIEFNQNTVPLKLTIQRFGAAKPSGADFFELKRMSAGKDMVADTVKSEFAPAQYFELSNDDKMSAPAFRELESGIRANAAALVNHGRPAPRDFEYRDSLIDSAGEEVPPNSAFARLAGSDIARAAFAGGAAGRSDLFIDRQSARPTGDEVVISKGSYRIVDAATMQAADARTLDSSIAASQALDSMVTANPALSGKLLVVADYEMG